MEGVKSVTHVLVDGQSMPAIHTPVHINQQLATPITYIHPFNQDQKSKTNLELLHQQTVNGNGISWAMCKSAPHPRQITTTAPLVPTTEFLTGQVPFLLPN